MGRSIQASAVCVHVCVKGWGVNVIDNLLMSPKACPLPQETDRADAAVTMGHLCHCHPEQNEDRWGGGANMLTGIWGIRCKNTEQAIVHNKQKIRATSV